MSDSEYGFFERHRNCPYCGAGTSNGNRHAYFCMSAVVELASPEVPYPILRQSWREGATAVLKKGTNQRDKLRMVDPLDKAYVQGVLAAQSALLQRGRHMVERFAHHLDILAKDMIEPASA